MSPFVKFVALAALLTVSAFGAERALPDKSAYSFFRPTPEQFLRDLSTDRPDITESPYTVDAGWWQAEADVVTWLQDDDKTAGAHTRTRAYSITTLNLKAGLTPNIDLQTVLEPFNTVQVDDRVAGTRQRISGFGDITSRLKINLWGNDGGRTAFALMPFVKWPTNRHGLGNHSVEGGLIAPLAVELPAGWSMGVMTELDFVDGEERGRHTESLNTITFSHDITRSLGGFVELTSQIGGGRHRATFDCGITYAAGRHVQLDAGAYFGLSRAADDVTLFTGVSARF